MKLSRARHRRLKEPQQTRLPCVISAPASLNTQVARSGIDAGYRPSPMSPSGGLGGLPHRTSLVSQSRVRQVFHPPWHRVQEGWHVGSGGPPFSSNSVQKKKDKSKGKPASLCSPTHSQSTTLRSCGKTLRTDNCSGVSKAVRITPTV